MNSPAPRSVLGGLRFGSIRARMTAAFAFFVAGLMVLMGAGSAFYLQNQAKNRLDATLSQAMGELREEVSISARHHRQHRDEHHDEHHDEPGDEWREAHHNGPGSGRRDGPGDGDKDGWKAHEYGKIGGENSGVAARGVAARGVAARGVAASEDARLLRDIAGFVSRPSDELRHFGVALLLVDERGQVLAHSDSQAAHFPPGAAWRSVTWPQENHVLVVAAPWERVEAPLRQRLRDLLLFGSLAVVFSSLGAWFLVGRTLSPLDVLARQARSASAENLRLQLETPSSDAEMVNLVGTLNDLLARLAQKAAAQGRFYAAASHELRTPLHSLNALQEVALSRPRRAEELLAALRESHTQTGRLTRLVQDLLVLNQLEAAATPPERVCLDLADICEGELRDLAALIAQRSLQIETHLPPTCELMAPWSHVKMLVRNLTENAVKYAGEAGRVRVEASPCRVRIWNECEVPANLVNGQQFEPFHRPDAARGSHLGGNGLGLSICRAICDTNGWNLSVKAENGGVQASVDFGCEAGEDA